MAIVLLLQLMTIACLFWFGWLCLKARDNGAGALATLGNYVLLLVPLVFLAEAATNSLGVVLPLLGLGGIHWAGIPAYAFSTPVFWVAGIALAAWMTHRDPILPGLPESLTRAPLALALPLTLAALFLIVMSFPWIDHALYAHKLNYLLPGVTDNRLFPVTFRLFAGSAWWAFALLFLGMRLLLQSHPGWGLLRLLPMVLLFALPYSYLGHLAAIDIAQDFMLDMGFYGFAYGNAAPVAGLCLAWLGAAIVALIWPAQDAKA